MEFLAEEKDRFAEAVIVAERADAVIMCLGLDATIEGEEGDAGNEYASGDKPGLKLPGLQQELLETVTATGKPVILVLLAGSAIDLSWADNNVDAIICAWYPGARGEKQLQKQYLVKIHHQEACQLHFMQIQRNFQISAITV